MRPDTKFTSPGYINVLHLETKSWKAPRTSSSASTTLVPTASYEIGHYDHENTVLVADKQEAVWAKFSSDYLYNSIPCKIREYQNFRRRLPSSEISGFKRNETWSTCPTNCSIDDIRRRMPQGALQAMVTVQQCYCPYDDDNTQTCDSDLSTNMKPPNRKRSYTEMMQIANSLSVIGTNARLQSSGPTFFGQEHQQTTEMKLGDVLDANCTESLCIAQETILSVSSGDKTGITCHTDGTLPANTPPTTLSSLAPGLILPSHLLPHKRITLKEVNLWFAPQLSNTNYHYDANDNLLMVLHGTKTVEMSPPGTIQANGIHSDRANHPALLSSTSDDNHNNQTELNRIKVRDTQRALNSSTMVVSISAGEALFIPEGWWHRVESSSQCLAVNVWFDHLSTGPSYSCHHGSHTLPHAIRELSRRYFQEQFLGEVERLMKLAAGDVWTTTHSDRSVKKVLECVTVQPENDTFSLNLERAEQIIHQECQFILRPTSHCGLHNKLSKLVRVFNTGLVFFDIMQKTHRLVVLKLFQQCFEDIRKLCCLDIHRETTVFSMLVKRLSPICCLILTRVWEMEENDPLGSDAVSHLDFITNCGPHAHSARRHLEAGVDTMKETICKQLIVNDLILGK